MTEIVNSKQVQTARQQKGKRYDLEDGTLAFACRVRAFVKKLAETESLQALYGS